MLKIAKIKSPNTKFYLREAANTGFENESFDGVMSLYTFDHMKQAYMNKALNEVKRILKLGAPFLLIQHHGNFEGQKTDLMAPNKKLFRNFKKKVWLSDWLTQNGFRIIFSKVRKFPDIGVEESASNQVIVIAKKI
jgi:ubiquinone/menaquinone biosynthesis C-methylase UbiE